MSDVEIPQTMHIEEAHDEQPEGERQLTPREITMNAIAEKHEARRQEEMALGRIYDDDARAAGLTFPEDEQGREPELETREPETRRERAHTEAPREYVGPTQPATRVVEVDGRRFEVTNQQYDELAQMGALANVALHQYNNQQPQQPSPQQPPEPAQPLVDPELVRETVRRIQYGGEEDGATALSNLVQAVAGRVPQQQPIDTNRIIQQAAAYTQQQQRYQADIATIQQEYKDVFADPQRQRLAEFNVNAIRQRNIATGKYQSDLEVYREAGDLVLNALNLPRSQPTEQAAFQAAQPAYRQDVIERKRTAPKPTTQVDRRAPSPSAPRQPSGSEIVERMRQQRGQASMM
jgi:hypothetical protein